MTHMQSGEFVSLQAVGMFLLVLLVLLVMIIFGMGSDDDGPGSSGWSLTV